MNLRVKTWYDDADMIGLFDYFDSSFSKNGIDIIYSKFEEVDFALPKGQSDIKNPRIIILKRKF